MNVHIVTEMHGFIVADPGNRTTISRDPPRDPPLESAHFTLQSASSRINQRLPREGLNNLGKGDKTPMTRFRHPGTRTIGRFSARFSSIFGLFCPDSRIPGARVRSGHQLPPIQIQIGERDQAKDLCRVLVGMMGFDQRDQLRPGHHLIHLRQKLLPSSLLLLRLVAQ